MKAQKIQSILPSDEIKGEILKSKNLLVKLILKPLLDRIILLIIEAILKKFRVIPKHEVMALIDLTPEGGQRCDKYSPHDPHYGEAGDYDENCNWIPYV